MSASVVLVPMAHGTKLIVAGRVVAIGNDHRRIARMANAQRRPARLARTDRGGGMSAAMKHMISEGFGSPATVARRIHAALYSEPIAWDEAAESSLEPEAHSSHRYSWRCAICLQATEQAAQIAVIATVLSVEIFPGVTIADAIEYACAPSPAAPTGGASTPAPAPTVEPGQALTQEAGHSSHE